MWNILPNDCRVCAFVGGGGKTTTLFALAYALSEAGKRVAVTTTTHMRPHPGLPKGGVVQLGRRLPDGKLGPVPEEIGRCLADYDVILVEADGSRGLPLKAPADHEPVIPPEADLVVAVAGLDAVGQAVMDCCHRPERVCALLGVEPEHLVTAEDVAAILESPLGGRKQVPPGARYACVLNKAETPERRRAGERVRDLLAEAGIPAFCTDYEEKERGGACWF